MKIRYMYLKDVHKTAQFEKLKRTNGQADVSGETLRERENSRMDPGGRSLNF